MSSVKKTASAEDQQQINKFARLHKNFLELKNELSVLNNETQNLGDADDEIMLLDDEDAASIPLQIGSIFVHYNQETASTKIEEAKVKATKRIAELKLRQTQLDNELKELRAILYAKFGDNIHLEMEAED
uniref:Prefoldin subunit 4 n=1 Tax=Ditylenchus dipsaci TaxID=166011 RepID=A0A915E4A7_9BILA